MNRDEIREFLGAWAVDAVDDVERRSIERALADDSELAEEAARLRDSVASLADAERIEPPAQVRADVLAAIEQPAQPGQRLQGRPKRGVRRFAIAAAMVIAVGVPAGLAWQADQEVQTLQARLGIIIGSVAADGAQVTQAEVDGGGSAARIDTGDSVVFAATGLPEVNAKDYQLWMLDGDVPVSLGVLTVRGGDALADAQGVPVEAALAVTIEPAGGSTAPTTDPVVVLTR